MKIIATCFLVFQIILFFLLTVLALWGCYEIILAGGGFDGQFASIQLGRLIAFGASYIALPISIVLTFLYYKKERYHAAIWLPAAVVFFAFVTGQLYLRAIPEPIQENFGNRTSPYVGFLILPAEAVPPGFQEKRHHYSKREYSINLTKIVNGRRIDLDVMEGDNIIFDTTGAELIRSFQYQGITGQIYVFHNKKTLETSFNLVWLNPPKQRVAIYLTQAPNQEYSPEDLIKILKNMRVI